MKGDPAVFVLLGVVFAALGVYLVLYSRHRAAVIRRFAGTRGHLYTQRDDGSLEARLGRVFQIDAPGCARTFGQVRDIVSLPGGTLFRAVELIDLNPHASAESSHHARSAVLFHGAPEGSGIFQVGSDLAVLQRYPQERCPAAAEIPEIFRQAGVAAPPHTLSLSFAQRQGLAYLEPAVTGSVTEAHLTYLADLADRLSSHFSSGGTGL